MKHLLIEATEAGFNIVQNPKKKAASDSFTIAKSFKFSKNQMKKIQDYAQEHDMGEADVVRRALDAFFIVGLK